jgi:hypothetical protein
MVVPNALGFASLTLILAVGSACQKAALNAVSTGPTPKPVNASNNKGAKSMNDLIQKVMAKDPTATLDARKAGPAAAEAMVNLTANEDPVIRELALRCLFETGGQGLARIFARFLTDESGSVRGAALAGVSKYLDPSVAEQLFIAYDKSADLPEMREQIALLIGRIDSADANELRARLKGESDQLARDGLVAALAKLGDEQARAKFVDNLRNAKSDRLKRHLDYVDYIDQEWAAKALGPILLDKTPLIRVGIDGLPDLGPGSLRACDIAVNLIAKILKKSFSFPVDMKTQYTDAQLQEVRSSISSR